MASAVVADGDMAYPRLSDATYTVDAVGAAPDTAPASPVSPRSAASDEDFFGVGGGSRADARGASAEELAAAAGAAAAAAAAASRESAASSGGAGDGAAAAADMSSSSYFRPYVKSQSRVSGVFEEDLQKTASGQPLLSMQHPFPKAKETVLQNKLSEAAHEVRDLRATVDEALSRPHIHPAEVRQILKVAENVLLRNRLPEAELQRVGWPSQTLQLMREVSSCMEVWEQCEEAAKQALANEQMPLPTLIVTLEQFLAAWCRICQLEGGPLRLDMGLERRSKSAAPMLSAMLDKAMGLLREAPDVVVARQLEALLQHGAKRSELRSLGIDSGASQYLQEIGEAASGVPTQATSSQPGETTATGSRVSAPEVLWRAVVDGDARTVLAAIQQGGLVSGRTQDPQGHTVLWDAVAFQRAEVALLLLRHFPAGMAHGVCLGELHKRNGNSLLHLVAGFAKFSQAAEALFTMLFEQIPDGLRMHKNKRGQTIAHAAAARSNFWVLRFLAANGFLQLFNVEDNEGTTPRKQIESTMAGWGVAEQPAPPDASASRMPSWCPLSAFQPPAPGARPPLADVVVTVEDDSRGRVDLHAHRVILATNSAVWNGILLPQAVLGDSTSSTAAESASMLTLEKQQCSSAEAALFALRFLYTGDVECPFRNDTPVLLQLLQLCASCVLPAPLCCVALDALLLHIDRPEVARAVLDTIWEAEIVNVSASHRHRLARCFVGRDAVWEAVEEGRREKFLQRALAELEPALVARLEEHARAQAVSSLAVGSSGQAISTGPLGTGWLQCLEEDMLGDTRSEATLGSWYRGGC